MISFEFKPNGALGFLVSRDAGERLDRIWSGALVQAATEYATGRLEPVNVKDRFRPDAFGTHGYQARSTSYQAKQRKHLGRVTPFVSPRRPLNFQKVTEAILKPSTGSVVSALRDLDRQMRPHLKDTVTKPGIGWRIRLTGKRRKTLRIAWPATRMSGLNGTPYAAAEWKDLKRGGAAIAILGRAKQLVDQALAATIATQERVAA